MDNRTSRLSARLRLLGFIALIASGVLTTLATGGGGGGGGASGGGVGGAPTLSNLTLSPAMFEWMSGGGRGALTGTVNYIDPQADITSIRVQIEGQPILSIPVPSPLPSTSGQLIGDIEFSTTESGIFTAEVWAVDSAGNTSNRLTATVTIVGSSRLSDLSISAAPFDQIFYTAYFGDYTAAVNLMSAVTTVTATTEDPNSEVSVNGTAVQSGVASEDIALQVGVNNIEVTVTTVDGSRSDTYTIELLRNALDLTQRAYIKASNTDFNDIFGESLALSGDTLVVTGRGEDSGAIGVNGDQSDNGSSNAGAAYVFVRDPSGIWTQQAYLKASNAQANDYFGSSAAIYGDTLAIGAVWEASAATGVNGDQTDNSASSAGAVYVFSRDMGLWSQQAYIKSLNTHFDDLFGAAVVLNGETLVVGAPGEYLDPNNPFTDSAGGAYVYTRDGTGAWTDQAYLTASDRSQQDSFGTALAIDGDTLVVGAPERFTCSGCDTSIETGGKAYVFTRDGSGFWTEQALLQPDNVEIFYRFGSSVALEGDTLAIGAPYSGTWGGGAVYVYQRDISGIWIEQTQLVAFNTSQFDNFGSAVALKNGVLIVGASGENTSAGSGDSYGAIYVFSLDGQQQWVQQAYLRADNRDDGDAFGSSLTSNGETLVVGAIYEDSAATGIYGDQADNSARDSGAVYSFE